MEQQDIIKLVQGIQSKLKKNNGDIAKCEWHDSYHEQKELCAEITVHAQRNSFPEKMMRSRAPNETEEELNYRKDNFEPITMPYWYRAVSSIVGRIWSEQNHTLNIKDEEHRKYFLTDYPVHGSLIKYFKSIVTPYKINDPNAVLALKIGEVPEYQDEQSGEKKIDQTKPLSPTLQIYGCHKLLAYELNEYALVLSDEKSIIAYNGKNEKTGIVFFLYDKDTIYKISQTGKKIDWVFKFEVVYEHNLDYLPVWKLKGIPKQEVKDSQDELLYYSYFTPAIPLLNKALKQDSTLDASISKTAFPVRTYYEDECDAVDCNAGKVAVYEEGKDVSYKACPKCNGTGKGGIRYSPLKDYVQRPPRKNVTDEEAPLPFPAFAYVSPDTTILEFLKEKITSEIIEAFTFINIDVSKKGDNTGDQTAIKVKIDREELFSFLLQFSSEDFDLYRKSITTLGAVRYGADQFKEAFTLQDPKTFEIYTADELTVELGEAKKAGVPELAIREITKEFMAQRFAQQEGNLTKIIELVFNLDAYVTKDTTEIAILKSNNLIALWEAILHENIYQFISGLLLEDDKFLDKDFKAQKEKLIQLAKEKALELKPNTAANILEDVAGGG